MRFWVNSGTAGRAGAGELNSFHSKYFYKKSGLQFFAMIVKPGNWELTEDGQRSEKGLD
jgi:hypothetical protein